MSLHPTVGPHDQQQGKAGALLTLVEYGDYECPHCGAAYPVIKRVQEHFGDQLLFVFRNFPLGEMHPHAVAAACTAEAAGLQGRFWPVHDLIFEHQQALGGQDLLGYAATAGADMDRFAKDVRSSSIMDKVEKDMEGGLRSGVNGTPTFFINGQRYNGYNDFEGLKAALEHQLA